MSPAPVQTHNLRLDGRQLDAVMWSLGCPSGPPRDGLDPGVASELQAACSDLISRGVLREDGGPGVEFGELLGPLFAPWLIVQAAAFGPAGEEEHVVWVAPSAASAAGDLGDGRYDLISTTAAGVPAAVVRLLRLGPSAVLASGEVELPSRFLDELVTLNGVAGSALVKWLRPWPAVAESVSQGDWRLVHVSTQWAPGIFPRPEQAVARSSGLLALDTPTGLITFQPGSPALATASSATDLWELLIELTSPPAEIFESDR